MPLVRTASYQSLLRVFGYTKFHLINTIISFALTVLVVILISIYFEYYYYPIAFLLGYFFYNLGVVIYISWKDNISVVKLYGVNIILKQVFILFISCLFYYYFEFNKSSFLISNLTICFFYLLTFLLFFSKKLKKII